MKRPKRVPCKGFEIRNQSARGPEPTLTGCEKWPGKPIFPLHPAPAPVSNGVSWWVGISGPDLSRAIREQQSRLVVSEFGRKNVLHYQDDVYVERKPVTVAKDFAPAPPKQGLSRVPA